MPRIFYYDSFEAMREAILVESNSTATPEGTAALKALRKQFAAMSPEQRLEHRMMADVYEAAIKLVSACHVMNCTLDELIRMLPVEVEEK